MRIQWAGAELLATATDGATSANYLGFEVSEGRGCLWVEG